MTSRGLFSGQLRCCTVSGLSASDAHWLFLLLYGFPPTVVLPSVPAAPAGLDSRGLPPHFNPDCLDSQSPSQEGKLLRKSWTQLEERVEWKEMYHVWEKDQDSSFAETRLVKAALLWVQTLAEFMEFVIYSFINSPPLPCIAFTISSFLWLSPSPPFASSAVGPREIF